MNLVLTLLVGAMVVASGYSAENSTAPARVSSSNPNDQATPVDPVQREYEKLIAEDEAALQDVEKIVKEFEAFAAQGAAGPRAVLAAKVDQRLEQVAKAYEDFLTKHPKHVDALLAYGSFLNETGDEAGAIVQWEKARESAPENPTPWNNLANIFGHIGPVKKAFQYYEKAIELDPNEPVYIQNLATTTYLFRKDAAETYRIDEQAVFDKALALYRRAMKLDPANLALATDYAQSYYGIRPARVEDALAAWNHALTLAKTPAEKQGIYLHLARVELNSGKFEEAQAHLDLVDHPEMQTLKDRLARNLRTKKAEAGAEKKSAAEDATEPKNNANQPGAKSNSSAAQSAE